MAVTIIVTKELDGHWATDEEFNELTDEQIIELLYEDIADFLDGAIWEVKRVPTDSKDQTELRI